MSTTLILVFVYGTLKRNQPNHKLLTDHTNGNATFLIDGNTIDRYPLLIGTRYNIPFLLNVNGTGNRINGEIYNVDENMLRRLDELEGHPHYYLRQQIDISENNGTVYSCWTYFLKEYPNDFLENRPLISTYNNSEDRAYVPPSQRDETVKAKDDLDYRHQ